MNATNVTATVEQLNRIANSDAFGVPSPVFMGMLIMVSLFLIGALIAFAWAFYRGLKHEGH